MNIKYTVKIKYNFPDNSRALIDFEVITSLLRYTKLRQ